MIEHFLKISKIENYGIKDFDLEKCAKSGYKIANRKKDEVERKLDEYHFPESSNEVDLSKVIKDWFPLGQYDIFLSHSHSDEKKSNCYFLLFKRTF